MAYTTVVSGTTITAAWSNANVRDQVVTPFVDAAARTSAISAPVNGMVSVLTGTKSLEVYTGAAWTPLTPANLVPTAYTPTVTWTGNTIGTQSGFYLKTPGKLELWVSFTETAGTAAAAITITMPAGYTVSTHTASLPSFVGTLTTSIAGGALTAVFQAAAAATTTITTGASPTGAIATYIGHFDIPTTT